MGPVGDFLDKPQGKLCFWNPKDSGLGKIGVHRLGNHHPGPEKESY